uniref:Uncharacterized protein n=1 Tax=Strigamia maritima TaxID=126957 RepID=T1JL65_STRMM
MYYINQNVGLAETQ